MKLELGYRSNHSQMFWERNSENLRETINGVVQSS